MYYIGTIEICVIDFRGEIIRDIAFLIIILRFVQNPEQKR